MSFDEDHLDPHGECRHEIQRLQGLLKALVNNPHICLTDLVYTVRDNERLGWDGPAVKSWGETASAVQKEFQDK